MPRYGVHEPEKLRLVCAFRHKESNQVIVSVCGWHNILELPGYENADEDNVDNIDISAFYEDGFADQNGKFYTRDEIAKLAGVPGTVSALAAAGYILETED